MNKKLNHKAHYLKISFFIVPLILSLTNNAISQSNQDPSSFFSNLYFPFDIGVQRALEKNIDAGVLVKTGIEYRNYGKHSWFIRFNFDNRSNKYSIRANETSNIIEGKLKFNDYLIGAGYRIGSKKLKAIVLLQTGATSYEFPTIDGTTNSFILRDNTKTTFVIKPTLGVEFYLAPDVAITFETGYIFQPGETVFWDKQLNVLGSSIGITAKLF